MNDLRTRVCDLAQKRVPPRQIASILNVNVDKVYSTIRVLRTAGVDIPSFNPPPRPISPNELARDLIEAALLRKVSSDG